MNYEKLVASVNDIVTQYTFTLTLRQIYYQLVTKNLIPNTRSSYNQLSSQLVTARENGEVDASRIEDRSRSVLGKGDIGFQNPETFMQWLETGIHESWKTYSRPLWKTQPNRVLIIVEKDALSKLFTQVAQPFNVQVYPTKGYGSYTFIHDITETVSAFSSNWKVEILYFGDYDPSGRDIERDLTSRIERYSGLAQGESFNVHRVALTEQQIQQHNLPPIPTDKETLAKLDRDTRTRTYGLDYAVELDALNPSTLQALINQSILSHIDLDTWNRLVTQVNEEQQQLRQQLET